MLTDTIMRKRGLILLLTVLLLGTALRIYQLEKTEIFKEETATIFGSRPDMPLSSIVKYWLPLGHFPTYYICTHYWLKIFGTGDLAARSLPLIFGIASIYIIFLLGKKIYEEETAVFAAYLLAVSNINIYYSQFARAYSMINFFAFLSFFFLIAAIEKNYRRLWMLYIFSTLLYLLLGASTIPIIISQIAFAIFLCTGEKVGRAVKINLLASLAVVIAVYLPSLLALWSNSFKGASVIPLIWISKPSWATLAYVLNSFGGRIPEEFFFSGKIGGIAGDFSFYSEIANIFNVITLYGIFLFALCIKGIFASRSKIKNSLLCLWLGISILLPFLSSFFVSHHGLFGPIRYVLPATAPYYLLISAGIYSLKKRLRLLVIVLAVFFSLYSLCSYYGIEKTKRWEGIRNYIKTNMERGERVAFLAGDNTDISSCIAYGFFKRYGLPIVGIADADGPAGYAQVFKQTQLEWINTGDLPYRGIWLYLWFTPKIPIPASYERILKEISSGYVLKKKKVFPSDTIVYHFQKP